MPANAPIAMPVKAAWPKESEKNAMRFDTTMVLNTPNNGVIRSTARKAFFIKLYSSHSKGSSISSRE